MATPIDGVKKFSGPMFIVFVVSKILVGVGLGVLLYQYLEPYGLAALITGVVLSAVCLVAAFKNMGR